MSRWAEWKERNASWYELPSVLVSLVVTLVCLPIAAIFDAYDWLKRRRR